jgi:hypothetical protein
MKLSPIDQPDVLKQVENLSELFRTGKDEMNFAEFPMTSLSDKPITGETSLKFEDQIYDDRKKKHIPRKRIIEGSKEYGLPTATDDSVLLALIQLTKLKNAFTAREVEFSRHELITLLQWPNKGQSYKRIAQSLHRLASVTYHFENSWWDNQRKAWTTKIFGIIDTVELNDSRESDSQGGLFPSRIIWNQIILDSFQAGYLRTIDFQLAISFKHAISLRIYRFMGKRFHLKPDWTLELKDFAYEHMGLARSYEGGTQIARKLKPALAELEEAGFLLPLSEQERFIKKGREWFMRLVQKTSPLPALANAVLDEAPKPSGLIDELIKRGVTAKSAAELVENYPAAFIEAKLEEFDWEMTQAKPPKKPAGYLVKSIIDGYATDPKFVSKAERQRREDAARASELRVAEERRIKQEAETKTRELAAKVDAYVKALTPEQHRQVEAEALAQASEETRLSMEKPEMRLFKKTAMLMLVKEHVERMMVAGTLPILQS